MLLVMEVKAKKWKAMELKKISFLKPYTGTFQFRSIKGYQKFSLAKVSWNQFHRHTFGKLQTGLLLVHCYKIYLHNNLNSFSFK